MATPVISKSWANLPSDYSFTDFNQYGRDIMDKITLALSGDFTLLSQGETTPADTNYLWYNYGDNRIYRFYGNTWIARHPIPPSSNMRQIWVGSETSLKTYDGGEDAAVSDATGPFWEVDTAMAGRFPLPAGTLESGLVVEVGDTGGLEKVTLDVTEMPQHYHAPLNGTVFLVGDGTAFGNPEPAQTFPMARNTAGFTANAGGDPANSYITAAHDNMPPWYGLYLVKRTARLYYTSTGATTSAPTGAGGLYFGTGAPAFSASGAGAIYVDVATREVYVWDGTDWGIEA